MEHRAIATLPLVQILFDIEYTGCFIVSTVMYSDIQYCAGRNRQIMSPILSALPLWWRFLQQIRRYYLTREVCT
jgi:hypothetical protein